MKEIILCKGGCGNKAAYKGWCDIKWKKGNRVCVTCPELEEKRIKAISAFRIKEARLGLNPMQNPKICIKNHSKARNIKASQTLKKLGKLRLLPQQTESRELRERRLMRIRRVLRRLAKEGRLNHQMESKAKKMIRHQKIAETLERLARERKLPIQNFSREERIKFSKKISRTLKRKIRNGEIKLNDWGKRYRYGSLQNGELRFRSKWEREVAKFLDKNDVNWKYEALVIPYYDKESKLFRNTIPDFYIPDMNLFIEVKGNGEFKSQNTQDKLKGIKQQGYKIMLFGKKQINVLRKNPIKMFSEIEDLR
ncbi:MAG: hypothetical protein NTU54_07375 [Candidatus Omnitrophica bacterium]|nr:hypothetical protein [Candidatus Omnitrophota bacterium]